MATVDIEGSDATIAEVGDVAEAQFCLWCTQSGLVANRVTRDKTGWDYLIEYSAASQAWRADQVTCKVQIKGTAVDATAVPIKLSNFARMASDPHPWFVVVLSFDERGTAQRAHVVHVDEQLVARAYERVRVLPPGTSLHDRTLTISWGDCERLDDLSGAGMSHRIKATIGESMWEYVKRKESWQECRRFAEYVHGTLSIVASSPDEARHMLANLAIGIIERIPVESVRIAGVTMPEQVEDGTGFIELAARPSSAESTIELEVGMERALLRCKTFTTAQVFPMLPEQFRKIRFQSTFLSLTGEQGTKMFHWHLAPVPKLARLCEMGAAGRAVLLLAQKGCHLKLLLGSDTVNNVSFGCLEAREQWHPDALQFARAAVNALWLAAFMELDVEMLVDARGVFVQEQQLMSLRAFLDPKIDLPQVRICHTDAIDVDGKPGAIVLCPGAVVGDVIIVACVAHVGTLQQETGSSDIEINQPTRRLVEWRSCRRSEWDPKVPMVMVDRAVAKLLEEGLAVATVESREPNPCPAVP
jgi:hypothetical protein